MKKLFLIFLGIYFLLGLKAQEETEIQTLFGQGQIRLSGFGGPFMNFSLIDGKFAHLMGGGGAILINNFFLGGYGIGLTNSIGFEGTPGNELGFGHGGFWLGYNFMSRKLIHPSFHMQLGWGKISERLPSGGPLEKGDNIFVIVPTLELEMNITKYFKISAGGNYRFIAFIDDVNYSESDFMNPGVFLGFKFGWF
jgi:hypothetical protein